ncbi:MAG: ABC transporter permease [Terracidiphilus sp.]|jgi:predicted permease
MGSALRGFVYGFKAFSRSPVFAVVFVVALAVGIGAAVSVFTVVDALILRPLALPHPEQLAGIAGVYRGHSRVPISYPMFAELEREQHVFSGICAWTGGQDYSVEINGRESLSDVRSVTGNYYSVLGVRPLLGRLIGPGDTENGRVVQVAVIGYQVWRERFGGDPNVVGKTLHIDGKPFTIVGVTQKWFTGMTVGSAPEITVPTGAIDPSSLESRSLLWLFVTGRLANNENVIGATGQLQAIWPRLLQNTVPLESTGTRRQSFLSMGLQVDPVATGAKINGDLRSKVQRPLNLLLGIVALILLVICVNLASLTLARASSRSREISTRIALGASPWQAVRQFVVETLILSSTGGLLALFLAYGGSQYLISLMTRDQTIPALLDVRPDWRVICFAVCAATFTGLLTGLIPALQLSRQQPGSALREGARTIGPGAGVLNKALIISQVAISLILLQTAGLFMRTLESLKSFNPGFERAGVTEFDLSSTPHGFDGVDVESYRRQLADAVASLPSVRSIAFSNLPILGATYAWKDTVTDALVPAPKDPIAAARVVVTPGFFRTLGIPLTAGRDFAWSDDKQHPSVAIIDGLLAKQLFGAEDSIGKRIHFGVQPEFQNLQIVGVSQSARLLEIRDADGAFLYVPSLQHGSPVEVGTLLVRGTGGADLRNTVEREIESFGREYSTTLNTLAERSDRSLQNEQMTATLSTFFASIALLVAGFGLFGLLTYSVTLRTREIGIRIAMGSQRAAILNLILREAMQVTLIGIGIGLPCAIALARIFAHMLFALSYADPVTLITASVTLLFTGMLAGLLPAIRAMKLEPVAALRHE